MPQSREASRSREAKSTAIAIKRTRAAWSVAGVLAALTHDVVFNGGRGDGLGPHFKDWDTTSNIEPYLGLVGYAYALSSEQVVDYCLGAF